MFPKTRMYRLRKSGGIRRLVRDVSLTSDSLLYPIFIREGLQRKEEINGIPGQFRYSLNDLDEVLEKCKELKIPGILIFGIPKKKDLLGSSAYGKKGIVQSAIRNIKENSNLAVFSDVCLCQYTSNGHCGILEKNKINNDKTIKILEKIALSHAESGVDFVAPSAMMDGQVSEIRKGLDTGGFTDVGIMGYSAKFASSFYSPFREAVDSTPKVLGDRSTYQLDFHSTEQAIKEISIDVEEGADIVMVKPAMPYLDIISEARRRFDVPIAAYQVSGEYAILKSGIVDFDKCLYETLTAIKRAGANFIITYGAMEIAHRIRQNIH